jgi:hypothetical protein
MIGGRRFGVCPRIPDALAECASEASGNMIARAMPAQADFVP